MNPIFKKLHKLEEKGQKLQAQLWEAQAAWEKQKADIDKHLSKRWAEHCEQTGKVTDYSFRDVTAC